MTDFHDLVDTSGLAPEEEARLRRAHDLLVQAGPPPDLPPELEAPPTQPAEAEILQFPLLPQRRFALVAVAAATVTLIAFGGGYFFGHSKSKPTAFKTERVVAMHGRGEALAVLRIAAPDSVGNWPMEMQVSGLPSLAAAVRLLRALADQERQGSRTLRHVPRAREEHERALHGAVQPSALRRLDRDRAAA